jgi:ABC-type branched-subunit amino acid transport system substrate-binding protein
MARSSFLRAAWAALAMLAGSLCWAETSPIIIGMTEPLSGPDAAYGAGLRDGAALAIERANASGGIGGRHVQLLALDDGGEPQRAAANARELMQRGVLAMAAVHGAPSTSAVASVIAQAGAGSVPPLVGPVTGAASVRQPPRPNVFFLRASISDEASAAILHLDTLGISRYAVIAQADPLGESGMEDVVVELTRIAIRPVASERVSSAADAAEVRRAVGRACAARPEALVLAVDAQRIRVALAAARAANCAGQYVSFSETGAALASLGGVAPAHQSMAAMLVTQVVPNPGNRLHPLVAEYQSALKEHGSAAGSYPSLEGYLAVRVIQEALRGCGHNVTRECLEQALMTRSVDVPGMHFQLGAAQRPQHSFVEMTLLDKDGRFMH